MEKKFEITLGDTRLKSTIPAWQPVLDYLEKALNDFLNITGYTMDKDRVMLISVTDGEYNDLMNYLEDLRAEKDNMPHWELESNTIEPNPMFKVLHCSRCNGISAQLSQYCPHCGARMYSGREMLGGLANDNEVERY